MLPVVLSSELTRGRSPVGVGTRVFFKRMLPYYLSIALAAVLLWIDQRFFFLFAFITVANVRLNLDVLRTQGRFYQFLNEMKLIALMRHLAIAGEEVEEIRARMRDGLTPGQRRSLDEDVYFVTSGQPIPEVTGSTHRTRSSEPPRAGR